MARLFFAVAVSPEVASAVEARKEALRRLVPVDGLRFTDAAQSHLTIRFLGERSAEQQEAALRAGRRAAGSTTAFDLVLETLGVFPDERRPHTLWIGTGAGGSRLVALAGQLESDLKAEGFEQEERAFVPHLTIARIKGRWPPSARDILRDRELSNVGSMRVENFALMESRPKGRSREHVALEVFSFMRHQSGR